MTEHLDRLKAALAGRYAIEREIGSGGMATVYLAEDVKHHRRVALKVLRPDVAVALGSERFLREIEIAAGLAHPHVLPLHDSGEADGFLYYVMPYVEGETLRQRLTRERQLPIEEALRITRQVAGALAHAHRQGFVHRDIKPENILLAEGHALVADFGIGKVLCDVCDDSITVAGTPIGTPAYMSPEQAMGEEVDQRSDIYSLGCVLFEMLAGDTPFSGKNAQMMLMRHAVDPIPSIRERRPGVSESLDAALTKSLTKEPDDRYQTAADLVEALVPEGTTTVAPVPRFVPVPFAPARRPSRLRGVYAAVALGAAIVAAAGAWWLHGAPSEPSGRVESLAVLPLVNLSGDPDQDYFVDGMHEALIVEVAKIGALKVISRTSVMRYRNTEESASEIARELNVDAVLEGSILRAGDSVRITAQLVAVDPERHLWTRTYDRGLRGVLQLHTEVARAITGEIEAELTPRQQARLPTSGEVAPEVLDAYLRGRFHVAQGSVEGFRRAIEYYEKAIQQAPDFAPAHSAHALAIHLLGFYHGLPERDAEPRAKAAAERALELDDGLAEARAVLAGIRSMFEWDWAGAERDYRQAIALDPNSAVARQWYAYHLTSMRLHDEAIAEARRGLELDPFNPVARVVLADQYFYARRYDAAIGELQQVLQQEPGMDRASGLLENIYALTGRYDEVVVVRRARTGVGSGSGSDTASVADLEAAVATSGASGYWRWRIEQLEHSAAAGYVAPSEFAAAYAALGENGAAIGWLEQAYRERDGMELLQVSPRFDLLRGDPRFQALLDRMNFRE